MSKKIAFTVAALLILVMASIEVIGCEAVAVRSPGLGVGSTASYSLICSAVPAWEKLNISVTKVGGTTVSYYVIFLYSNDTIAETLYYTSDVQQCDDQIQPYIIAANLSAGDQIAEYPGYPQMINQTILMDVAGSQRLVNYRQWLSIYVYPDTTDHPYEMGYDLYWDKATGITVKANVYWSGGLAFSWEGWFNWTLISMNISPPTNVGGTGLDMTTLLLVGGGVVVAFATIAVVAVASRRR